MSLTVKICGVRDAETARTAFRAGADFVGLVFAPSRRRVRPEEAAAILAEVPGAYIGVFQDVLQVAELEEVAAAVALAGVQLHGHAPAGWIEWARARGLVAIAADRSVRQADVVLLDGPKAGSGIPWDWRLPAGHATYWLAGGLTVDNVGDLVRRLRPAGVDVSSGVERDGQKAPDLIEQFVKEAKGWQR